MLFDVERSGLKLNKAAIDKKSATVGLEIENTGYALTADAVHKALSIAEVHLPKVELVDVVLRENDHLAPRINPTPKASGTKQQSVSIRKIKTVCFRWTYWNPP